MRQAIVSIFELRNDRGYFAPKASIRFSEQKSDASWYLNTGGTRCYVTKIGAVQTDADYETAASHWMVERLTCALLMARAGLFVPTTRGRLSFEIPDSFVWNAALDLENYSPEARRVHDGFSVPNLDGWYSAICTDTGIRRAVEDLALSVLHPREAFVFISRGFEWIVATMKIPRADLAKALNVNLKHLKELGRLSNDETGMRHASKSGRKLVADVETYGSWTCGLVDAINYARHSIDPSFVIMSPAEVADLVFVAMNTSPYP